LVYGEALGFSEVEIPYCEVRNGKIYFDVLFLEENINDADVLFITHDHYDHLSKEDILKVINENTIIVCPENCVKKIKNICLNEIVSVIPGKNYQIDNIKVEAVPAYNTNKNFHPKEKNWVGYILTINGMRYYIAGDTDITEENKKVNCDIALIPVGGTYTMNYKEAAELINIIKPKIAIPTHYGSVTGTKEDGINFSKLVDNNIEVKILI